MSLLKKYYQLAKPERTYANLITASAGFLLASKWHIHFVLLIATLVGMSLVIASACVLNNYIDRDIDKKMARTKKRALPTGTVPPRNALIYSAVLGILGFLILLLHVSVLVFVLGVIAYVDYVVLYGWGKRHSVHGTLIGTVSGALPITAGYCAARGHIDGGAVLVFLILTFWQMPHFFAIAIYRLKDYANAGLPVLPVKKGVAVTKRQILLYMIGFTIVALLPTTFGYTHYVYLVVVAPLCLVWLRFALQGFKAKDDAAWARHLFLFSLVVLLVTAFMLPVGAVLP